MRRSLGKRVTWLEENTANAGKVDESVDSLAGAVNNLSARVTALDQATDQRFETESRFVRGGEHGPGLAGEVRELQAKVDLILTHLGLTYMPERTVGPYLEADAE